ncbi:F0F1 ATP synthase subunit delta [Pelomonas aquatica]|jgi:F-type H+-transporting ATPase subunit delta|uniref:ATP synthase subunit delta n=1 Tax=Pelomonas aquatica TaxID=431058 RepID=A0A9X4LJH9_9BURK|nr:F0F1 ATP synthase subunit delta [Pelomonas aquatica]MCY4756105.1 F0F1 ATP synthase subunit delta [Pelomonas aquatica]MDG0864066.1 F0F1 ATP synthase subunit delta [Pelomonas aquatica]
MAEIATIARPYAEALFQVAKGQNLAAWGAQLDALAQVAQDADLRQFADHPKAQPAQVVAVMTAAAKQTLAGGVQNLLQTVVENGRLAALPEIVAQYHVLANAASGVSDAQIYSAFEISDAQLAELKATLEKRFGRKLDAHVQLEPGLIGGVRVVVGDEVLDTSVKARLERMKVALTA